MREILYEIIFLTVKIIGAAMAVGVVSFVALFILEIIERRC